MGLRLALRKEYHGYSWQWAWPKAGPMWGCIGWADPSDKVCALALACEDLAKSMGWEYVERE